MEESTYRLLSLILQGLGFGGAIITLGLIMWQIRLNTKSIQLNTRATELGATVAAASGLSAIGKLFVEKPYLRKYFYEGEPVPKNSEKYEEAEAAAMMVLDFFATMLVYSKLYTHLYPESDAKWRKYIEDMFFTGPILREVLTHLERTERKWYADELYECMATAIQRPS